MQLRHLTCAFALGCLLPGLTPAAGAPALRLPDMVPWELSGADYFVERQADRLYLRFSAGMVNVGTAPLTLAGEARRKTDRLPALQVLPSHRGLQSRKHAVGEFVLQPEDARWELFPMAEYRLLDAEGGTVVASTKMSFCTVDSRLLYPELPGAPRWAKFVSCPSGRPRKAVRVGVSIGWADIYSADLDGQRLDVTDVPNGRYVLEIRINPLGRVQESSHDNNVLTVPVEL